MKRWIVNLLGFALLVGLWAYQFHTTHHRQTVSVPSPKGDTVDLAKLYSNYNDFWFDNTLPKDMQFYWDNAEGNIAVTKGLLGDKAVSIHFNPYYNRAGATTEMSMLHEQCHIKLWTDPTAALHGETFEKCMLDLATRGAMRGVW